MVDFNLHVENHENDHVLNSYLVSSTHLVEYNMSANQLIFMVTPLTW